MRRLALAGVLLLASCTDREPVGLRPGTPQASQYGALRGRPVLSVTVSPAAAAVAAGCTVQLDGAVLDQDGNHINRPVIWSSSNTAVARVDQTGLVIALSLGTAVITGRFQQQSATAQITVTAAAGGTTGFCISVDARPLTVVDLFINSLGPIRSDTQRTVKLSEGNHTIAYEALATSFPTVTFSVTPTGTVTYDPALEGILVGQGTATLTVRGVPVSVDARAQTNTEPLFLGFLRPAFSNQDVATFTLLPGVHGVSYEALATSFPGVEFTVTTTGTVDYDASMDGMLEGRGTSTLVVLGRTIQVDARPLTNTEDLFLGFVRPALTNQAIATFTLLPGVHGVSYEALATSFPSVEFRVTPTGTVDYDNSLDGVLDGRGTSTLVVRGRTIQVDATSLIAEAVYLGFVRPAFGNAAVASYTVLPGIHGVAYQATAASFPGVEFAVSVAGTVSYDPALEGILQGQGTGSLTVRGSEITVDASQLGVPTFTLGFLGVYDATSLDTFHLLPGNHGFDSTPLIFEFAVTADGLLDFDSALDPRVSGRGTRSLGVH